MTTFVPLVGHWADKIIILDDRIVSCSVERVTFVYFGGPLKILQIEGTCCFVPVIPEHPNCRRLMALVPTMERVSTRKTHSLIHVASGGVDGVLFEDCTGDIVGDFITTDGPLDLTIKNCSFRRLTH